MISANELTKKLADYIEKTLKAAADSQLQSDIKKRINELKACGLGSEQVCFDLIASELKTVNGKAILLSRPKRIKGELFDKVNFMCRAFMDRMERIELEYDFEVDEVAFKTAVIGLLEKAPVFRSRFVNSPVSPYWKPAAYNIDEAVLCTRNGDYNAVRNNFFEQEIPTDSNLQLRIQLIYTGGKTHICYLVNHMCVDGIGYFTFISDICRNYTDFIEKCVSPLDYQHGSRAFKEVYADMDKESQKKARKMLANIASKIKCDFPYTPAAKTDKPILVNAKIEADTFKPALKKAKTFGASGNDLLIAAYMTAYKKLTNSDADRSLNVTTAINLRRHVKDPKKLGYTNLMSFFNCTVEKTGNSMEETLKAVCNSTRQIKTDPFVGLSGLPLLDIAYKSMIYAQAEPIVKLFYSNPSLSVSNLGQLDKVAFSLCANEPKDVYAAGAVKQKPCAVATCISLDNRLNIAINFYGNEKDRKIVEDFLSEINTCIADFSQQTA